MNPFKYVENYFFEESPSWGDRAWFYGFIFTILAIYIVVKSTSV